MAPRILYLFPDTNLFIQCSPLDQLDWTAWKEFDEVHLIVSRPVQSEIDHQKNRGSDRVGRRARAASGLLREIILNGVGYKVVRDAGPTVKLFIRPELKTNPELSDRLDYRERDDQLVGTAHSFMQQSVGVDARVLTHDTGPMASAQMVRVPIEPIPDDWLLPPETTEAEKKIRDLENEVARLRRAEPDFRCLSPDLKEIKEAEIEVPHYLALTKDEVSDLMGRIASRFPVASELAPREAGERERQMLATVVGFGKKVFVPATHEEIWSYQNEKYPEWLRECEKILRDCHDLIERRARRPAFMFSVTNDGIRPAKDALITIEAKGHFEIMPPRRKEKDDDENKPLALARPPRPPQGRWEVQNTLLGAFESLQHAIAAPSPIGAFRVPPIAALPGRRDPNGFYWKPRRPEMPASEFSLECEQWRHGIEPELFEAELYFDKAQVGIGGALECRIHAENLSRTTVVKVPVRFKGSEIRAYETASAMVEALVRRWPKDTPTRAQP